MNVIKEYIKEILESKSYLFWDYLNSNNQDNIIKRTLKNLGIYDDEERIFLQLKYQLKKGLDPKVINQIFAVLNGAKPMWYGTDFEWSFLGILGDKLKNKTSIGLKYKKIGKYVIFGKPENVNYAEEFVNMAENGNFSERYHIGMGVALGYPEKEIVKFIEDNKLRK